MKLLFTILIILIVAIALALVAHQDPGWVVFARGRTDVRMTLTVFIILAVISFALVYFLTRLLITSIRMPNAFRDWRSQQKRSKARRETNRGLVKLAEGNWAQAERHLLQRVANSDIPLLNYLSAAKAAQKQNAEERRDNYLALARDSIKNSSFAVDLTQVELQLVQGQFEQSLASLVSLHTASPKHSHVLFLLARTYELLRRWSELRDLIPQLRKYKVINDVELEKLELSVHRELMRQAAAQVKSDELLAIWQRVPKSFKQNVELLRHYVRCLLLLECKEQAEQVLRDRLKRSWDVELAYLYGLIDSKDKDRQLAVAETWLKDQDEDPILLLTLGRLCMRNKLWGKAQSYLKASLGFQARSDTYKELGDLFELLEEHEQAASSYRQGLMLAAEEKMDDILTKAVLACPPSELLGEDVRAKMGA